MVGIGMNTMVIISGEGPKINPILMMMGTSGAMLEQVQLFFTEIH